MVLSNFILYFRFERHRRASFLLTNWDAPVDPRNLAKYGFFRLGIEEDVTRCHFCRLEIRGWEQGI
jgi:hypothetical protein